MGFNLQEYIQELRAKIFAEKERLIVCFSSEPSPENKKTAIKNIKSGEDKAAIKAILDARSSKKKRSKVKKRNENERAFWE
jgi:hypothetical protein